MSSLSVVVFKHGVIQPQATVQLNGPGGVRSCSTNQAGAVNFSDLLPGRYTVNVAHFSEFLGNGFMDLSHGQAGVIHIKYPKPAPRMDGNPKPQNPASLSVKVFAYLDGTPSWAERAKVTLDGPSPMSAEALMGLVNFTGLRPGEYTIRVQAVVADSQPKVGVASVRLLSGGSSSVEIALIDATKARQVCDYGTMTIEEVKQRIRELEAENAHLEARAFRQSGDDTQFNKDCVPSPGNMREPTNPNFKARAKDGLKSGEATNCVSRWVANRGRSDRYQKTLGEINSNKLIIEAMKASLECLESNLDAAAGIDEL